MSRASRRCCFFFFFGMPCWHGYGTSVAMRQTSLLAEKRTVDRLLYGMETREQPLSSAARRGACMLRDFTGLCACGFHESRKSKRMTFKHVCFHVVREGLTLNFSQAHCQSHTMPCSIRNYRHRVTSKLVAPRSSTCVRRALLSYNVGALSMDTLSVEPQRGLQFNRVLQPVKQLVRK